MKASAGRHRVMDLARPGLAGSPVRARWREAAGALQSILSRRQYLFADVGDQRNIWPSACWDCPRSRAEGPAPLPQYLASAGKAGSPFPMKTHALLQRARSRCRPGCATSSGLAGRPRWSSSSATAAVLRKGGEPTRIPSTRVYGRLRLGKPVDAILDTCEAHDQGRAPRPPGCEDRRRHVGPARRAGADPKHGAGSRGACGPRIARERSSRAPSSGPVRASFPDDESCVEARGPCSGPQVRPVPAGERRLAGRLAEEARREEG
jgi:hypothetical protein